jgi:hypothetical protein
MVLNVIFRFFIRFSPLTALRLVNFRQLFIKVNRRAERFATGTRASSDLIDSYSCVLTFRAVALLEAGFVVAGIS